MKLSRRERFMFIGGAIVAGLTILYTWVAQPLGRRWTMLGRKLEPALIHLDRLKGSLAVRQELVVRRARLVRRLGSLTGGSQAAAAPRRKTDGKPDKSSAPPPDAKQADKSKRQSPEAALAGIIKKSGAQVKRISPRRAPRPRVSMKHFTIVALQVETESNAESLVKMLHALETGPRFFRVGRLKIRQDLKKPGKLRVSMDIVAYAPARGI